MDMEGALRARIIAAATLAGSRVYWDERPQNSVLPDVTLTIAPTSRQQHMGGFQSTQATEIQADVRAASFANKKQLKEQVIAAVAPKHTGNGISFGPATDVRERTLNERTETQFFYRDVIEFTAWHSPA
jgi:hypothetical protein